MHIKYLNTQYLNFKFSTKNILLFSNYLHIYLIHWEKLYNYCYYYNDNDNNNDNDVNDHNNDNRDNNDNNDNNDK